MSRLHQLESNCRPLFDVAVERGLVAGETRHPRVVDLDGYRKEADNDREVLSGDPTHSALFDGELDDESISLARDHVRDCRGCSHELQPVPSKVQS